MIGALLRAVEGVMRYSIPPWRAGTLHPVPRRANVRWQPEVHLLPQIYDQGGIDKIRMIKQN